MSKDLRGTMFIGDHSVVVRGQMLLLLLLLVVVLVLLILLDIICSSSILPWNLLFVSYQWCVVVCIRCYGMALKQQPTVSALWHDLGVGYYHLMKVIEGHLTKVMAAKCVEALKQSLTLDASNHCHWNALGVAAAHSSQSFCGFSNRFFSTLCKLFHS